MRDERNEEQIDTSSLLSSKRPIADKRKRGPDPWRYALGDLRRREKRQEEDRMLNQKFKRFAISDKYAYPEKTISSVYFPAPRELLLQLR